MEWFCWDVGFHIDKDNGSGWVVARLCDDAL